MKTIENLVDLENIIAKDTVDKIVTEYILIAKGKADILDRVVKALDRKDVTIDEIRDIVDGKDIKDFME